MTLEETLGELLAMDGRRVIVSVCGNRVPTTVIVTGVLRRPRGPNGEAARFIFFPLDEGVSGICLDRESFEGAGWDDGILRVRLGPLLLTVEEATG